MIQRSIKSTLSGVNELRCPTGSELNQEGRRISIRDTPSGVNKQLKGKIRKEI